MVELSDILGTLVFFGVAFVISGLLAPRTYQYLPSPFKKLTFAFWLWMFAMLLLAISQTVRSMIGAVAIVLILVGLAALCFAILDSWIRRR